MDKREWEAVSWLLADVAKDIVVKYKGYNHTGEGLVIILEKLSSRSCFGARVKE